MSKRNKFDHIRQLLSEIEIAISNPSRISSDSDEMDALLAAAATLGAGLGGVTSFTALFYGGAVAGLSAAGVTSGLAAAGAVVGGGMVAGIAVIAAPVAIFGYLGYKIASKAKEREELKQLRIRSNDLVEPLEKAIEEAFTSSSERLNYLKNLQILLRAVIKELQQM